MPFEHYIQSGGKRLRCGYTTGTCAALAAAGAARLLLGGRAPESVTLTTPGGLPVTAAPRYCRMAGETACCAVEKDGGDADALGALAEENSGDSTSNYNKGKYEKASKEDVTDTLKAWLFDEKRKEGDTALLKDEDAQGYQLVYFEGYGEKYHWQDVSIAALQKEDYDKWYEKVEKTYDDKITTSFMYRFV